MLNLLNRNCTKAEKLIFNIREKENELWKEYLDYVHEYGEIYPDTLKLRSKWNIVHEIMNDSGIKTITEIKVKQNDKEKI